MIKNILIKFIEFYQINISPFLSHFSHCKYTPTCSEYGKQAIIKYGAIKGFMLALWRIIRCNPFSKGGFDPVP